MRCTTWNVNGIRSVAKKSTLPWDVLSDSEVICLQETKAQPDQLDAGLRDPAGWHAFWHSAEKPGYSSVAIITKVKPDDVVAGIGDAQFDREGRVLAVRFGNLVVVSAYFPNSREAGARLTYKLDFCTQLERYLAAWREKGNEVLLMGDYNIAHQPIDLARPKENEKNAGFLPEERAWMTRFLGLGYRDVFRERNPEVVGAYSWWTNWGGARQRNVGWRIDYGCLTPRLVDRVTETSIQSRIMGSDHCPVTVALS